MGFMSRQWLNRGQGLRNRKYWPTRVNYSACRTTDAWSSRNEVLIALKAINDEFEHQILYMTQEEVDSIAKVLIANMSAAEREALLLEHLSRAKNHSPEGISSIARILVARMTALAKETLVVGILRELSDAKLLRVLAFDLRKRKRLPKEQHQPHIDSAGAFGIDEAPLRTVKLVDE